jgi:hypothetical protein
VPRVTIDPQGRITAADLVTIAIPASALTDGTTGSGPVVLANNPAMGTVNAQNMYVAGNVVAPTIYVGQGLANGTLIVDGSNQATIVFEAAGVTRFQIYRPPLSNDLRIWSAAIGDCITFQYTTGRVGIGASATIPTVPLAVGVNNTGLLGATGQLQLLTNGSPRFFAQDAACFTQGGVGLGAGAVPSGVQLAVGFPNIGFNGSAGQLALLVSGVMRMTVYDTAVYTSVPIGIGAVPSGGLQLAVGTSNSGMIGSPGILNLYTGGTQRMTVSDNGVYTSSPSFGVGAVPSSGMQFAVGVPNSGLNGAAGQLSLLVSGAVRMAVYDTSVYTNVSLGIGAIPVGAIQLAVGASNSGLAGSAGYLFLYTGGSQRLVCSDNSVYTSGNFGVGVVPNGPQLAIGAGTTGFAGDGGALYLEIGAAVKVTFSDTQVVYNIPVGIGVGPGSYTLAVVGNAAKPGGGSWSDNSDARLKENIRYEFDAMAKIRQLKPSLFDWRDGQTGGGGFIAQDVEEVFPEFVSRDAEGDLALTLPFKFDAYLVRAIQQLEARLAKIEGTA